MMNIRKRMQVRKWPEALVLCSAGAMLMASAPQETAAPAQGASQASSEATLDEARLTMGKWIETQQIISRERNDWQQGKEILVSRIDLVKKEVASLEEKIKAAQSSVEESNRKRDELLAEQSRLVAAGDQLTAAITLLEGEVRKLHRLLPGPIQERVQPLFQRIPENAASTKVSTAERFQNVLGVLNEVTKANNEITITYEVRNLTDGKPAEVRVMYVGLAQAYYVSAGGDGGIGRPGPEGWVWEPSKDIAGEVLLALEIVEGKHTAAFVPLPVKLQ